jgi:hypothetical protein
MIEQDRLDKIWKRTVIQLLIVVVIGIGILGSYLFKIIETSTGPKFIDLAVAFIMLIAASLIFLFFLRAS